MAPEMMDTLSVPPKKVGSNDDNRLSIETAKPDVEHIEIKPSVSYQASMLSFFLGEEQARQAILYEQRMTLKYALGHYKTAVIWAILMAAPALMEGYQTFLMAAFSSYQPFCRFYGTKPRVISTEFDGPPKVGPFNDTDGDGFIDHSLATHLQFVIPIGMALGQITGLIIAPRLSAWFGYRCCVIGSLWNALFWLGLPVGASFIERTAVSYVSDICPLKLKAPAAAMLNVWNLVGQMISSGVLRASLELEMSDTMPGADILSNDAWAFRIPMFMQFLWVIPLLIILRGAPESPQVLARKDKDDIALRTLKRLSNDPHFDASGSLAAIKVVDEKEKSGDQSTGVIACFYLKNLRRTEVGIMVFLTHQLIGATMIGYTVKMLQKSGVGQKLSFVGGVGLFFMCTVATFASMYLMRKYPRRKIWLAGLWLMTGAHLAAAVSGYFICQSNCNWLGWVVALFLTLFSVVFCATVNPLAGVIVSEIPTTRLKTATNAVGRGAYVIMAMINLYFVPNLLEDKPTGWGFGPRSGVIWAIVTCLCILWAYFRLPETKDRTPAEIDIMFDQNIPMRDWADVVL